MSQGRFIQAGAEQSGVAVDGYGEFVTVERLEELERKNVRQRMDNANPEMFEVGVKVMRAKIDAEAAVEQLRKSVHATVGPDGVRAAFAMMTKEASEQAAADAQRNRMQAQQKQQPKR